MRASPGQGELFAAEEAGGPPVARPRISAATLSARLGHSHAPTAEQARVIEHTGPSGRLAPYLVVAGAGSGKTETMAARVVWLVANRLVRPERILGLTFTRKAAAELAERVGRRLDQLRTSGLLVSDPDDDWHTGEPTISTYHAYAGGLFAEHALRIGREPGARLLEEAVAWQYAGRVVDSYDGDMSDVGWAPATVVGAVKALAADLSEHLVEPAALRAQTEQLVSRLMSLPPAAGRRAPAGLYAHTRKVVAAQRARLQMLAMVEAFEKRKRDHDRLDYGDQVALAARIASGHPEVGEIERGRYDVVLLDEYQDTGSAQRHLLTSLFEGGHPVTAVGDPCQSIYGWRGASAGNLRRFVTDFAQPDGMPCEQLDLTTSFRNGGRILAVANRLSGELRREGVPVRDLTAGPKGADSGDIVHAFHRDAAAEADWVADHIADLVGADLVGADLVGAGHVGAGHVGAGQPTVARRSPGEIAVLTRTRAQFERIEAALVVRGIPVEVSGLGGLLTTREVADVVATLAAVSDPSAGAPLLRLLTGPRWRLGPRDLDALGRRARQLASPPPDPAIGAANDVRTDVLAGQPAPATRSRPTAPPDGLDARSLVEALDDPGASGAYSAAGWERILALRSELRGLRMRADQPLPDLVADVIRTSRLDVETSVAPGVDAASGRVHLDRFLDVTAEFAETEQSPTIPAFLAYLEAAADYERGLELGRAGAAQDAVQLLTVHGAKGLEWPVVILPGLVDGQFPSAGRESTDWCTNARVLPFPLRGDAADLPELDVAGWADQGEVKAALSEHHDKCAARVALEERRLAYVAATRAADQLVCSGYWWDHTKKPRRPSPFLLELRELCAETGFGTDAGWKPEPEDGSENPTAAEPVTARWPGDPLTPDARADLEQGAALVRAAMAGIATDAPPSVDRVDRVDRVDGDDGEAVTPRPAPRGQRTEDEERVRTWTDEVDKLVAERRRAARPLGGAIEVELPAHLSVSQLVGLRRDPAALARRLRRPVPLAPAPLARRGTAFHAWVEARFDGGRLLDVDELPGAADESAAPDSDLALLKERFEAGEWAQRMPVPGGVEVPFEMLVGPVVVRGRMDAVFRDGDSGSWEVVDWKTGAAPSGADAEAAAVQLAAYRLAWHRLTGEPLESVGAAFHYVRSGRTVRPVDLLDEAGLVRLVLSLPAPSAAD